MSTYRDVTRNQTQVKNLPQVHALTFFNCDSLICQAPIDFIVPAGVSDVAKLELALANLPPVL